MNTPKITVLMTVYNGGSFLPLAIESVLKQTYKDFELVIVDDCSTDHSNDYIKKLSDQRIILFRNPNNIGQTKSLNVGLRMARGQYVARMDADDMAYPQWLEIQIGIMEQQANCAVLSPSAVVMDTQDKIIKELNNPINPKDIILKSIFASPINHVGCLMQRETVLRAGGYGEQYKVVADYGLWSSLICAGERIRSHSKILVAVRTHAQSVSAVEANNKVIGEMTDIIRRNVDSLTQFVLSEPQSVLVWRTIYAGQALSLPQFLEGIGILKSIYHSFKIQEDWEFNHAQHFFQSQERVFFLKRIWGLIKSEDFVSTRKTAWAYLKLHGPFNIFIIIGSLTFLGGLSALAVHFYSQIISSFASQKVRFNDKSG